MDNKLTDEQVKKALDICGHLEECSDCPLDSLGGTDKCIHTLLLNALDLLNRKDADAEKLKEENETYREVNLLISTQRDIRDKEIEELQTAMERLENTLDGVLDREPLLVERAEKYAIEEFVERLKEKANKAECVCSGALVRRDFSISEAELDNLVKERVGKEE